MFGDTGGSRFLYSLKINGQHIEHIYRMSFMNIAIRFNLRDNNVIKTKEAQ